MLNILKIGRTAVVRIDRGGAQPKGIRNISRHPGSDAVP